MRAKYKGYIAIQKPDMTVHILKDEIEESVLVGNKRHSVKELRTLINKHIRNKQG